jgi:D-alanine transaminase
VHDGALLGPPKSEHVLEGIRVDLLRELCEDTGIAYNLRPISEADVRSADEVLLTSATKEVLPVTRVDGESVGHGALRGKPGPVYARPVRGLPARQGPAVDLSAATPAIPPETA